MEKKASKIASNTSKNLFFFSIHTFQTVANGISFLVSMAIAERTQLNSTSYNHTTGTLPWCCLAENCFSR